MGPDRPVQIADDVWWVGMRLENDVFQCHAYYLDNGDQGVLLDPGSPLTIEATLDSVAQITDIDNIRYLVCHHPDPDIAAGLRDLSDLLDRDDVLVVTEWRAEALLKHYKHRFAYYRVEDHDWRVPLESGPRPGVPADALPALPRRDGVLRHRDGHAVLLGPVRRFRPGLRRAGVGRPGLHHRERQALPPALHALHRAAERRPGPHPAPVAPHPADRPAARPRHPRSRSSTTRSRLWPASTAASSPSPTPTWTSSGSCTSPQAKTQITEALLTIAEPLAFVAAINTILAGTHEARDCALFIDLPDKGWTMWGLGHSRPVRSDPPGELAQHSAAGRPARPPGHPHDR